MSVRMVEIFNRRDIKAPEITNHIDVSYNDMEKACEHLAARIMEKEGKPGLIVYIQRGGMVPGRMLSDMLEVSNMTAVAARRYTGVGKAMEEPEIGYIDLTGSPGYILVVDDVADHGTTLKRVKERLEETSNEKVVLCTLYVKPQSVEKVKIDYSDGEAANETWIIFQYEKNETMRLLGRK